MNTQNNMRFIICFFSFLVGFSFVSLTAAVEDSIVVLETSALRILKQRLELAADLQDLVKAVGRDIDPMYISEDERELYKTLLQRYDSDKVLAKRLRVHLASQDGQLTAFQWIILQAKLLGDQYSVWRHDNRWWFDIVKDIIVAASVLIIVIKVTRDPKKQLKKLFLGD